MYVNKYGAKRGTAYLKASEPRTDTTLDHCQKKSDAQQTSKHTNYNDQRPAHTQAQTDTTISQTMTEAHITCDHVLICILQYKKAVSSFRTRCFQFQNTVFPVSEHGVSSFRTRCFQFQNTVFPVSEHRVSSFRTPCFRFQNTVFLNLV
jgi:hypothetical protein